MCPLLDFICHCLWQVFLLQILFLVSFSDASVAGLSLPHFAYLLNIPLRFFSSCFAYGIRRLSWWSLVVGPSLLWHRHVFIVVPSCFVLAAPLELIFDPLLERKSRVWVDRWSSVQCVGSLGPRGGDWKIPASGRRQDANWCPPRCRSCTNH